MAAIATGIKIGCRKLIIFAPTQTTAPAMTIRRTTKSAVSAAHIVFCCHGVGYSLMLCREDRTSKVQHRTSNIEWQASALVRYRYLTLDVRHRQNHSIGFPFGGWPLLILVFVRSIFSARRLFCGSSARAFCQVSMACAILFRFV